MRRKPDHTMNVLEKSLIEPVPAEGQERPDSGKWRWGFVLRLVAALGILTLLLSSVSVSHVLGSFGAGHLGVLFIATGLLIGAQFLSSWRWRLLYAADAPPIWDLFRLYLAASFASSFLPSTVGGDALRWIGLSRRTGRGARAFTSVILDRVWGVFALLLILATGMALAPWEAVRVARSLSPAPWMTDAPGWMPWALTTFGLIAAGAISVALHRSVRVRQVLADAASVLNDLRSSLSTAGLALVVSLMVQGTYVLTWMLLGWSMNIKLATGMWLMGVPLVSLAAMVPLSISGLGLREGAWIVLLQNLPLDPASIVAFGLLFSAAFISSGMVGGIIFALSSDRDDTITTPTKGQLVHTPPPSQSQ